ncbi:DNA pilot protein [Blackfly microvirus SF02]|uniref:DNA pilot protein n=1 Tax=Blackfly microvirus SF02 TaxID=2576452 RepID=A0A4P8PKH0_9VIRU|nr:DNA pilot protein [Blackfly microvirus SF02]
MQRAGPDRPLLKGKGMDPVTGALIGSIGGSLVSGLFGSSAQKKANKTNIQLQQKQLDWQERMANTEWQRGVEDMKAAGLNPMLAYSQGGASSPNVSAATVNPEDGLARGISSASEKAMAILAMKQTEANIELTKANTIKTVEEAKTAGVTSANAGERQTAELANIRAEYRRIIEGEDLTKAQRANLEELLPGMIRQQQAQLGLTSASTQSAKAEARIKESGIPEAEATAKFWTEMARKEGAGIDGDVMLKVIMMIRSLLK